nr:spore germination protein [Desulforamulus aquiferis]
MTHLTSFGIPYLAPFTPSQSKDFKDTIFRYPYWAMTRRPQSVPDIDTKRIGSLPPKGESRADE